MKLAALRDAIAGSKGPISELDLVRRLGIPRSELAAMLDALRASGQLGSQQRPARSTDACSSAGSCSMTCPGPDECSLVIDIGVTGFEIRSSLAR